MRKKGSTEDLSVEELRRLLVERRRSARQERLERFRRTGRVVTLVSDVENASLDQLHSTLDLDAGASEDSPRRSRRFFDALLLLVELAAVAALVFVLVSGVEIIQELNAEHSEVFSLPTLTPTPLIMAVVLPSGHTPPNSPGGVQPNYAEIPEHLLPLVQSMTLPPTPTPGPDHAVRIQVPKINVEAPIVFGDGDEQLKKGVGQHIGSANPGEESNVVLTAHNDVFGEIFRDLDQLQRGDQVILYTSQHAYTYVVEGWKIVEPTAVEVMAPTDDAVVTLISCYPYMVDNKRIVVTAKLKSSN